MKNLVAKNNVLIISLVVIIIGYIIANPLMFGFCNGVSTWGDGTKYCYSSVFDDVPEWIPLFFGPLSLYFLFFSLVTYFLREEVFRAWWNFARWWIPIIMLGTMLYNLMPSNHGFFNMDALIYLMVLAPLYGILILGSLWKIIRTHLRLKREGK